MTDFKTTVSELVGKMTQADSGKWELPEDVAKDLDEPTLFAVTSERRYRDTQAGYTKAVQDGKKQKAIADGLQDHIMGSEVTLSQEQKQELRDLKKTDPDAWRSKLNEYETTAKGALETKLKDIAVESSNKSEVEIREEQMAVWSKDTGIELTQEIVDNDLPPRFSKGLADGSISFEEFLTQAGEFLKADKVIKGAGDTADDDTLNLGRMPGGSEPSTAAQEGDFEETYKKLTF